MTSKPNAAEAGTIDVGGDLTVNRLGFGAMRITGQGIWGEPPDRGQARAAIKRAVELGVNFIDTADSYGPDVSETLIAETLYPYPDDLVIASKGGLTRPGPGRWEPDGRPEHLREVLEGSLSRRRVERIDLYQLHRPDPKVPLEESIGALAELKNQGKIRHLGVSNVTEDQLRAGREDHADRVRAEPLQRRRPHVGIDGFDLCEQEEWAFPPVGAASRRPTRWTRSPRRGQPRVHPPPDRRARVAAAPVAA